MLLFLALIAVVTAVVVIGAVGVTTAAQVVVADVAVSECEHFVPAVAGEPLLFGARERLFVVRYIARS